MNIFVEIGIIILIATLVSIVMRLLKQPLIVGYILSGIIVGPYFLNLVAATGDYLELFSKFGIAILLFIVGINLRPDIIREVGKASVWVGLGQVIFTSIVGFFIIKGLGFGLAPAILGSIALTFSSTIIVLKLISDKDDMNKSYAKISIGMLLVQDVVATFVLLFLSMTGSSSALVSQSSFIWNTILLIGKGFIFFAALYFLSKYVLPRLLNFLAKSQELLFLFSISWGIGLAALFHTLGFSIEIGALAAGIALASSPFSQEVGSRMKPLRDFFVLLFFVMLGSQMILSDIAGVLLPAILLSIFVLIGNPVIVFVIMNLLGYRNRTAFFTGLAVAQISEFSLILIALGNSLGYLDSKFVSLITVVGIITISGSTYFFIYADKIYAKLKPILHFLGIRKSIRKKEDSNSPEKDMIIFGYDRVGYDFVKIAKKMNLNYAVVDLNPEAIYKLRSDEISCYFGDAEDVDFLEEISVQKAKIVVSTIPDFATNMNLVSFYRNHNKDGIIIVISHNIKNTKELYRHGASFVVMPHYLGAKHASQMIENFAFKKEAFEEEKKHHLEYLEERQKKTE
jgi:Kef-type K+ transport system membrane component KefB/Trk K+ transport system NAD-binding subunit